MSAISEMMRAANPVPDPATALAQDDFEALLLVSQTRSGNMDVKEIMTPVEPETPRRKGWLVAAAAFAAIVVVVGVAALLTRSTADTAPATTPPTTETAMDDGAPITQEEALAIANAYVEASAAGDVQATLGMLAPDAAVFLGERMMRSDEYEKYRIWDLAQETVNSEANCTVHGVVAGDTIKIICEYTSLQGLAAAVEGSGVAVELILYITPDGIRQITEGYGIPDYRVVNIPFSAWMNANHPEDAAASDFGGWPTLEGAERNGLLRLRYGMEWAAYLKTQGCTYPDLGC